MGGTHRWVFFDDGKMSETYAEQITHCPGGGKMLEYEELRAVVAQDRSSFRGSARP